MSDEDRKEGGKSDSDATLPVRSEDYRKLLDLSLNPEVAERLDEIYQSGKVRHSDLDTRALDALKEFPVQGALAVLGQFLESNLEHVTNKSAYLCGVMKTYRQKSRAFPDGEVNGEAVKGPNEEKIKAILERTGYTLDVTTGQRKFGGPPPNWEGPVPSKGCEVFCGKIPRDLYEDELIPLFEKCGKIWDLRLMMDPMTGLNRGYAFVTFIRREGALEAVRQLDAHDLGDGKCLKINVSEPKTRLFIGNIPKSKDRDEIVQEFCKFTANLKEVIIYSSPDDKKKNRGFCFLEYETHKAASLAKRRLETGKIKVWSCDIIVDWADPQEEPDEQIMSQVKVLYVRNLTISATEENLREAFEVHGEINRVKKIKDYAFVHFEDRDNAVAAMEAMNGTMICGSVLEISLAKPPFDKKKKEEMLRKRELRMMKSVIVPFPPFPAFPSPYGPMYGFGQGAWGGGNNGGIGRGSSPNGRGGRGNGGSGRGSAANYDNSAWNWNWGDGSWQQRGCPPAGSWMQPVGESWNHSGVRGYPAGNPGYVNSHMGNGIGGGVPAGVYKGGRQQQRTGYTR